MQSIADSLHRRESPGLSLGKPGSQLQLRGTVLQKPLSLSGLRVLIATSSPGFHLNPSFRKEALSRMPIPCLQRMFVEQRKGIRLAQNDIWNRCSIKAEKTGHLKSFSSKPDLIIKIQVGSLQGCYKYTYPLFQQFHA